MYTQRRVTNMATDPLYPAPGRCLRVWVGLTCTKTVVKKAAAVEMLGTHAQVCHLLFIVFELTWCWNPPKKVCGAQSMHCIVCR